MNSREWERFGPQDRFPLLRTPLRQNPSGCIYAALARHMDYELRIKYGTVLPEPVLLRDVDLIDQTQLRDNFLLSRPRNSKLSSLLQFVESMGAPLWNSLTLMISRTDDEPYAYMRGASTVNILTEAQKVSHLCGWLDQGTVLGTMLMKNDRPEDHEQRVYLGKGQRFLGNHIVVILGLRWVGVQASHLYGCPPGYYFVYQDSRGPGYVGLFGRGRHLAALGVLLKVYKVEVSLPNELCGPRP